MGHCNPPVLKYIFKQNREAREPDPQLWFHDFGPSHLLNESRITEAVANLKDRKRGYNPLLTLNCR